MGFSFNDFTDASGSNCILCSQSKFVPSTALQFFQTVRPLTGTDGETAPLFTVVLRELQNVA